MALLKPAPADGPRPERQKRRRLKNVPVLPTLLTLGNLLCGFAAISFCMRVAFGAAANIDPAATKTLQSEHLERLLPSFLAIGAWCVFLGMVFDAFDGFAARLRHKASNFGVQLDSLADVVSFGVAPAILIIAMLVQAKHDMQATPLTDERIGRGRWVLAFVYTACAAIRLARFNVETSMEESAHRGFKGLPSPAAAGLIASLVLLHERLYFHGDAWLAKWIVTAMPIVGVLAALLMVSRFDYAHMINTYLRGRRPIGFVVVALALFIVLIFQPEITMAAGLSFYALTGPVRRAVRLWRKSEPTPEQPGITAQTGGTAKVGKTA